VSGADVEFISAVKPFNKLLEGSEAGGNGVEVLKSDDVVKCDRVREDLVQEMDSVLVRGVAVGDEDKFLVGPGGSNGFLDGDGGGEGVAGGVQMIGGNF